MYKIKRAIILAAGRGTRLRPYTNMTPKPLLPVNGMPIIEHIILALSQAHITDITIITGYRARQFHYLKEKYGVELRRNKDFNHGSNLLSLQLALDKIDDCVILDGDVIITPEIIQQDVPGSGYSYVKEKCACEWSIELDGDKITKIVPDLTEKHDFNALHSISYWVGDQAKTLQHMLQNAKDDVNYADDIMIRIPDLYGFEMKHEDFLEIDTVEEYENANKN